MNHKERVIGYDILMAILATTIVVLVIIIFICRKKKNKTLLIVNDSTTKVNDPPKPSQSQALAPPATPFSLSIIDSATDGFNRRRIIGEGPLGTLYAAVSESGELVAVKRIHPRLVLGFGFGFGFSSAMRALSRARHPNVVPIVGFSEGPGERIIVSELAGAATLDFLLRQDNLEWGPRIRIAAGAARGLEYLHEKVAPAVVHGRLKPSNIVVDAGFVARLCDYGLTFLGPKPQKAPGLGGYADKDYWTFGPSKESDVYSFGVVLVELLTGKFCGGGDDVITWALPLLREPSRLKEVLDPRLGDSDNNDDYVTRAVLVRVAKVASACVGNSRQSRPLASQVAAILSSLENEICFSTYRGRDLIGD